MDKLPDLQNHDMTAALLGAILKKDGPQTLREEHFDFQDNEADILLVYNDDNESITVALGVTDGEHKHEES